MVPFFDLGQKKSHGDFFDLGQNPPLPWWEKQYSPCLCEGVTQTRLMPTFGVSAERLAEGLMVRV